MIPFILAGGIANALMNLPIPAYQVLLVSEHFSWIYSVLDMIYEGTFGLFSLGLVITLSISFAMEKSEPVDQGALYVIISLGAYGAQLNIGSSHFDLNNIGTPVSSDSCFMLCHFLRCHSDWLCTSGNAGNSVEHSRFL